MNPFISKQLNLCRNATVPPFDNDTTQLTIPYKYGEKPQELKVGDYCFIKLENYILYPPDGFTLHTNWNNNIIPKDQYMKCEIIQLMGKMVKIKGIGVDYASNTDTNNVWEGWLPRKSFNIIKYLN